ncbi:MAG: CopD family protein [Prochlorococcus sp.]|jgi:putative copper export protein
MLLPLLITFHVLAATVWTGGHLILSLRVLPKAIKEQSAKQISDFEKIFEPLALPALAVQAITGLWMTWIYLPGGNGLFSFETPITALITTKLLLFAITIALAVHARLRLIPKLTNENIIGLAWHIRSITTVSVGLVVIGSGIRLGGF